LEFLRKETRYPDLERISPQRGWSGQLAALRVLLPAAARSNPEFDIVLMGSLPGLEGRSVHWIPDFQEERFPEFFRPAEVHARRQLNVRALSRHRHVMVSSEDVRRDVQLFYGRQRNRVHVVPFASFADVELAEAERVDLRSRYRLPQRFYICNSQMWRHKNHGVVLRALAETAAAEETPAVVFTGREHDYRHRQYAAEIKALSAELGITEKTHFLGFIPRADQLGLMSAAIAVIQPSLCEGWSGTVEDAKALGKHVLASDIAVHREQLDRNVDFFRPHEIEALARLLRRYREVDPELTPLRYEQNRQDFANGLLRMLRDVAQSPG
jgi:glycosyltransferase involved in cell wall biosynthesis